MQLKHWQSAGEKQKKAKLAPKKLRRKKRQFKMLKAKLKQSANSMIN